MTDISDLSQGARLQLAYVTKNPTPEAIAELRRKYPEAAELLPDAPPAKE